MNTQLLYFLTLSLSTVLRGVPDLRFLIPPIDLSVVGSSPEYYDMFVEHFRNTNVVVVPFLFVSLLEEDSYDVFYFYPSLPKYKHELMGTSIQHGTTYYVCRSVLTRFELMELVAHYLCSRNSVASLFHSTLSSYRDYSFCQLPRYMRLPKIQQVPYWITRSR